jgi:serine phosphatase RsbU (regulator of sigma subunit)
MLRMAVRTGEPLATIARRLNDQLCADLPHGRFITAWMGELNAAESTLTGFSAGQAPILRYRAAHDTLDVLGADTMPFGIMTDLDIAIANPIRMDPGDILAVISDGLFDAADHSGNRFGDDRAQEVILAHCRESPRKIHSALREAVARFTKGKSAADDRTGIIIKRMERK